MASSLNSCNKCSECSGSNTSIDGVEYCEGDILEDTVYDNTKEDCEAAGGKFN